MPDHSALPAITVVGSINIDFSVRADRLPLPGESVVGDDFLRGFGGKGANQAVGIARLTDRPVRFVGAVGDDELGGLGLQSLRENRIDTGLVRIVPSVSTGVALIMIDRAGENSIVAAPGANAHVDTDYVEQVAERMLAGCELLVICQEIPVEAIERVTELARAASVPVLFDPAPPNPRLRGSRVLQQVDYLTPNETEAAALTDLNAAEIREPAGQLRAMEQLLRLGTPAIALTLGAAGCCVFDAQTMQSAGESEWIAAPPVQAVDTTAAGDCFNAALAVALAEKKPFLEACAWANQVAAISVTRRGAQPSLPRRDELPFA